MLKINIQLEIKKKYLSNTLFFIKLKFTKSAIQRVFKLFKEKKNN